jgi:hypothetical protein
MPKDEFDFDDPMELNGVALFTDEDTMDAMCECFIEEFMRMGFDHARIFALFRHPHYVGMNMVLQDRGEQFVRDRIAQIFAQWGRSIEWAPTAPPAANAPAPAPSPSPLALDPTGSPAPTYSI